MTYAPQVRKLPAAARRLGLPVGGTLILLMLPDHFTGWSPHVWPILWTLWCLYWIVCLFDYWLAMAHSVTDDEWQRVFGGQRNGN